MDNWKSGSEIIQTTAFDSEESKWPEETYSHSDSCEKSPVKTGIKRTRREITNKNI